MPSSDSEMGPGPQREGALFREAIQLSTTERKAFLERACHENPALRQRLEALLAAHETDQFLKVEEGGGAARTIKLRFPEEVDETVDMSLDRYKLLEKVGEGGCGVVYVAEQAQPVRRRVALKIVKLGMDTKAVVARFEAERQALAMMDHPNIAKVFDAGVTKTGRPYFVMELVRGIRITEYCDQHNLSTRERLDLFIKVCQAVQHAHQKGIIHRDIKPSNILVTMLDGIPSPKVIDFGIAKAIEGRLTDTTVYTQLHQFIGTPAYMSPEQAEMSGLDIDTRSDIYSLGVLLYELLAGSPPFSAKDLMALGIDAMRRMIREEEPIRPSTRLATLPAREQTTTAKRRGSDASRLIETLRGELDWIVMKALEKDRTRRYETASSLGQDVQRYLNNLPVAACPPSAVYRLRKFVRRNRLAVTASVAITAATLISLISSLWALHKERESSVLIHAAEQEQRREKENAQKAQGVATKERDHAARLLSLSQAEHGVELLERRDPAGLLHLLEARKTVDHLEVERKRNTRLWGGWIDSLPSYQLEIPGEPGPGNWLATGGEDGQVSVWNVKSGLRVTSFKIGNQPVWNPEISGDGRLLIFNSGGRFQLWDLAPVRSNQAPHRLVGKAFRYAFDASRRRIITFINDGLPMRGEPPTDQIPKFELQIWDALAEPPLLVTWDGDRADLANHEFGLSVDGTRVAASWESLTLWDAQTGKQISTLREAGSHPASKRTEKLLFSQNGNWLWEAGSVGYQRYSLSSSNQTTTTNVTLHVSPTPRVALIGPSGNHFVMYQGAGIQIIDANSGEATGPMIPREDQISTRAAALSSDGRFLATEAPDGALRIWDTRYGHALGEPLVQPTKAQTVTFSAKGEWIRIIQTNGVSLAHRIGVHSSPFIQERPGESVFGFNPAGLLLTYVSSNRTMRWIDPGDGSSRIHWTVPDSGALVGSIFSASNGLVAAVVETGRNQSVIRFWNAATGAVQEPSITWSNAGPIAFSVDGKTLAGLSGENGSVEIWDTNSRRSQTLLVHSNAWEVGWISVRIGPDARFVAAQTGFTTLHIWDRLTGKLTGQSVMDTYLAISDDWKFAHTARALMDIRDPTQPRPVNSGNREEPAGGLAISPDNRLRVSSGPGNKIQLWEIATGRLVGRDMRTIGSVMQAVFNLDGTLLLTSSMVTGANGQASASRMLQLWETSSGLPLCRPAPAHGLVKDIWFDPKGRFLVVSPVHQSHPAQIWRLPATELPIDEMQKQAWLRTASRLDENGNVKRLSPEEMQILEASLRKPQ